jgi:uncharacterized membrane protein
LGILGYTLIRRPAATIAVDRPVALPIAITFVCVVIGACCLTWMVTIVEPRLPLLFSDATHEAPYVHFVTIPAIALSVAAVALLWLGAPQRSISG